MAKGNNAHKKEKKKKKQPKTFYGSNGKITKSKAMYDNQLVGMSPTIPTNSGY